MTSYQDIRDCLKLVIDALRFGDVKAWVWKDEIQFSTVHGPVKCVIWFCLLQIHRDSSSSLSKLVMQSYHQQIGHVSLSGVTPVHMLLEMGLDKMRKDYINYLIGNLILGMSV